MLIAFASASARIRLKKSNNKFSPTIRASIYQQSEHNFNARGSNWNKPIKLWASLNFILESLEIIKRKRREQQNESKHAMAPWFWFLFNSFKRILFCLYETRISCHSQICCVCVLFIFIIHSDLNINIYRGQLYLYFFLVWLSFQFVFECDI